MTEFAALHRPGDPLILPNAWDVASAAALVRAGFRAIGTTSLGVAAAAGVPDGAGAARTETLALARRLVGIECLLTVDIEGGFSDDPIAVAEFAEELYELGAVGVNVEDGRPDGTLRPAVEHAAIVAAIKAATPDLFVNARTDSHWLGVDQDATADRLARYAAAGADGVFVPGVSDLDAIAELVRAVDRPLNVLYLPGRFSVGELAGAGVARISTGSLLFRVGLQAAVDSAIELDAGRDVVAAAPTYAEVNALSTGRS